MVIKVTHSRKIKVSFEGNLSSLASYPERTKASHNQFLSSCLALWFLLTPLSCTSVILYRAEQLLCTWIHCFPSISYIQYQPLSMRVASLFFADLIKAYFNRGNRCIPEEPFPPLTNKSVTTHKTLEGFRSFWFHVFIQVVHWVHWVGLFIEPWLKNQAGETSEGSSRMGMALFNLVILLAGAS